MNKEQLREVYLKKRKKLSAEDRALAEQLVSERFFARVDIGSVRLIHHYLPTEYEFDPKLIVDGISSRVPAVQIAVPRVYKETLEHVIVKPTTKMALSSFGIREPVVGQTVMPGNIDLVLVPMLCFDREGHRVGYGGGYYDRFLAKCRPDCIKVGLSYFPPVEKITDTYEGDIPLDICFAPR